MLPRLQLTPRATSDIDRCRQYLRRRQSSRLVNYIHDVISGMRVLRERPGINPVRSRHPVSGLELRRHNVDQFVIIYAYLKPTDSDPRGLVSIRAIRHAREEDVFWGVNDSAAPFDHTRFGRTIFSLRDEG